MLTSYSQRVLVDVDVALVVTDVAVAVNVVLLMNIPFSSLDESQAGYTNPDELFERGIEEGEDA
jgi:hypothetical protein